MSTDHINRVGQAKRDVNGRLVGSLKTAAGKDWQQYKFTPLLMGIRFHAVSIYIT